MAQTMGSKVSQSHTPKFIASKYMDRQYLYGNLMTNTHGILKKLEGLVYTLYMELIVKYGNCMQILKK